MKKLFSALGFLFILLIFVSGCGPSYVVVGTRPQPPIYERPVAPGVGYVWIEGEWVTNGHGYVYRQGYWARPRERYHRYVPGHWQRRGHGWRWQSGYWN